MAVDREAVFQALHTTISSALAPPVYGTVYTTPSVVWSSGAYYSGSAIPNWDVTNVAPAGAMLVVIATNIGYGTAPAPITMSYAAGDNGNTIGKVVEYYDGSNTTVAIFTSSLVNPMTNATLRITRTAGWNIRDMSISLVGVNDLNMSALGATVTGVKFANPGTIGTGSITPVSGNSLVIWGVGSSYQLTGSITGSAVDASGVWSQVTSFPNMGWLMGHYTGSQDAGQPIYFGPQNVSNGANVDFAAIELLPSSSRVITSYAAPFDEVSGPITTSRRVKMWSEVPPSEQPIVFIEQGDQEAEWSAHKPLKWKIKAAAYAYVHETGPAGPMPVLNKLVSKIEESLETVTRGGSSLGGVVESARVVSVTDSGGALADQGVAVIDIEVMTVS